MDDCCDRPSASPAGRDPDEPRPTISARLFALAAVVWPVIVYAVYLRVAYEALALAPP